MQLPKGEVTAMDKPDIGWRIDDEYASSFQQVKNNRETLRLQMKPFLGVREIDRLV